jgi:hypothetical protein
MPWYLGNAHPFFGGFYPFLGMFAVFFPLIIIWSLVWSGLALWHSAKRGEKWWFIIFLFVHTAGILEIIYLFFVAKIFTPKLPETKPHKRSKK